MYVYVFVFIYIYRIEKEYHEYTIPHITPAKLSFFEQRGFLLKTVFKYQIYIYSR